jgi:hypothetical protein
MIHPLDSARRRRVAVDGNRQIRHARRLATHSRAAPTWSFSAPETTKARTRRAFEAGQSRENSRYLAVPNFPEIAAEVNAQMRHGEALPEPDGLPLRGRNPRRRPYAFKTAI